MIRIGGFLINGSYDTQKNLVEMGPLAACNKRIARLKNGG